MSWLILALVSAAAASLAAAWACHRRFPEPRWDWSAIDLDDPDAYPVPDDFLWGVATAAHQVEGHSHGNNWSRWEDQTDERGAPRIVRGQRAGRACDHWNRYREDVGLMKRLGVSGYRLSLAWDKIEPEPGRFDRAALRHYHEVIDTLRGAAITPMVTLHHFTHPLWFEDLGSFEDPDNARYLVRFAGRVFAEYRDKVTLWCTINEPAVLATQGWFRGAFPPGKRDPRLTAAVMANLVAAHVDVYRSLKAMSGGGRARIGLVKNIFQFEPSRRYSALDWWSARTLDHVFNGAILDCLLGDRFHIRVPGVMSLDRDIPGASDSLDFIGLNYYSHFHVRFRPSPREPFALAPRPGDIQTDMPYPIYAEGFHRALLRIADLGQPIYVTENGVADARDDRRDLFIRRYLHAMTRAMADGADVRGYFYWTLIDNFEWTEGYDMKFGLYAMEPDTLDRRLRRGARAFTAIIEQGGRP